MNTCRGQHQLPLQKTFTYPELAIEALEKRRKIRSELTMKTAERLQ